MKNMIMGEDGVTRLKTEHHTDFRYLTDCVLFVKIFQKASLLLVIWGGISFGSISIGWTIISIQEYQCTIYIVFFETQLAGQVSSISIFNPW